MAQAHGAIVKRSMVIRTTVVERRGHPVEKGVINRFGGIEIYDAADSTHGCSSPPGRGSAAPSSFQRSRTDSTAALFCNWGRPEQAKNDALIANSSFSPLACERT